MTSSIDTNDDHHLTEIERANDEVCTTAEHECAGLSGNNIDINDDDDD